MGYSAFKEGLDTQVKRGGVKRGVPEGCLHLLTVGMVDISSSHFFLEGGLQHQEEPYSEREH